ncbi:MAG TPA: cation-transporting P-type ATPase, partial [Polyangiaceae bacterium LLY-WYZ-15_(1-7)]|nr:cation-transporting P-type ATPase [Polyangiaceae bacterium LLY-WYZ-15_(1-7)]
GESAAVGKTLEPAPADAPLAERASMLFKGTALTRGAGEGGVVAVGMGTELGRITALVDAAEHGETPLEQRLDKLGRALAWASLAFVLVVAVAGVATGRDLYDVVEMGIALAVATVPEGLPIVATLALARGMLRMAERQALIEELPAVETLGSTRVVLTDKTGTLTENRMRLTELALPGAEAKEGDGGGTVALAEAGPEADALVEAGALCTDASWEGEGGVGDPMEVALLAAAAARGTDPKALRARWPELREEAFDPATKRMATVHRGPEGEVRVAVKGAPEAVLPLCTHARGEEGPVDPAPWLARAEAMGARGLRVLAVAERRGGEADAPAYAELELLGLVGLMDPPREDVREAIAACQGAGVRVVMVTGDQPGTARAIGAAVGLCAPDAPVVRGAELEVAEGDRAEGDREAEARLLEAPVVARCSPEQKLRLLAMHRRAGNVVAMIGDGVNDAPVLREADIGVAMGQRGTQVAREAAAMVLLDDRFATVPAAIAQGRVIFDNVRTFVVYLVSCNLGEILVIGLASAFGAPLPLLPLQVLFLNLVTDVFPALALGVGEGDPAVMTRPPRPVGEPFLTRGLWARIAGYAVMLTIPVLACFAVALGPLGLDASEAVTVSFLVLALGQLAHVFNMAAPGAPLLRNEVSRNGWVWGALALCVLLLALAVFVPPLRRVLGTTLLDARSWALVAAGSVAPFVLGRAWALVERARRRARASG